MVGRDNLSDHFVSVSEYRLSLPPPSPRPTPESVHGFMQLALYLTALLTFRRQRLSGRRKSDVLRPGIVGMRRSVCLNTTAMHDMSTQTPAPPLPLRAIPPPRSRHVLSYSSLPPLLGGVRFSTGIDGGAADGSTIGPSAEQQTRMTKFVKRLVWYPAVLIVSWTFATINRIQNAAHPDNPIFGLFLLHVSCPQYSRHGSGGPLF